MESNNFFLYSLFIIVITALIFCIIFYVLKKCSNIDENESRSRRPSHLHLPIYDSDRRNKQHQRKTDHRIGESNVINQSQQIPLLKKVIIENPLIGTQKSEKVVTNLPLISSPTEVSEKLNFNENEIVSKEIAEEQPPIIHKHPTNKQSDNIQESEYVTKNLLPDYISCHNEEVNENLNFDKNAITAKPNNEKVHESIEMDETVTPNQNETSTNSTYEKRPPTIIYGDSMKDAIKFLSSFNPKIRNPSFDLLNQFLKRNLENKDKIIKLVVIPKLIKFIGTSSDIELQKLATETILNLAMGSKDHKQAIFDADGIQALFKNLESSDHRLSYLTANALTMLFFGTQQQKQVIIDFCEIQTLVNLLKSRKLKICIFATFVILHIVRATNNNAEKKQEIIDAGVCPILVKLLYHPDKTVSKTAAIAVANLSHGNFKHCQMLVDAGIANALIKFMDLSDSDKCDVTSIILTNLTTKLMGEQQNIFKSAAILRLLKQLNSRSEKIQFIVLNVLEAIAKGTVEDKYLIVNSNGISSLTNLISPKINNKICKSAIKILELIARGNAELFQAVLDSNALNNVIELLKSDDKDVCEFHCETAVAALKMVVQECAERKIDVMSKLVELLRDKNAVKSVVEILKIITAENAVGIQAIIDAGAIPHFIDLLASTNTRSQQAVCEKISNISAGTNEQKQILIDNNAISQMLKLLHFKQCTESVVKTLSNIANGTTDQKEAIISAGTIPRLIFILKNTDKNQIYNHALGGLAGIADGTNHQKQTLINAGIIQISIQLLDSSNLDICKNAINILDGLIKGTKDQIQAVIDGGAIRALQKLLKSHDSSISENAGNILHKLITLDK